MHIETCVTRYCTLNTLSVFNFPDSSRSKAQSEMTNIEVLSIFFKLFEIFGLQYFSFKDLNGKVLRSQKFYKIYFSIILILFCSATVYYVAINFETQISYVHAKNAFNFLMKLFMKFGLIGTIFIGIVESFLKTNQLKEVYMNLQEISTMCLAHFDFTIDYKIFKKSWAKKFAIVFVLFVLSFVSLFSSSQASSRRLLTATLTGCFPIILFSLIVIKFCLHVDLVNFQLQNMQKLMSTEVFVRVNSTNPVNVKHILQNRALAFRKIYNIVYDTAQIVNNILSVSALSIVTILTVVIINTAFRCVLALTNGEPMEKISRESLSIF